MVDHREITKLDIVATNLAFPEGPVAMNDGSILFVEIEEKKLSRCTNGHVSTIAEIAGGPNGTAIGPDGAAYICNNGGVYDFMPLDGKRRIPSPGGPSKNYVGGSIERVDLKTGAVTKLYQSTSELPLLTPDDIVFDEKRGGFWFTDTGLQYPDRLEKGGVYFGTIDGAPLKKVVTITTPNGIGLSPDGDTLYVSDTIFGRLWALTITGPGTVAETPMPDLPGAVVQTLPGFHWVDSLKVLQNGNVCVGTISLEGGGITTFDTKTGDTTEFLVAGEPFVTNLCFGGPDMQDVWITASSTGILYHCVWPDRGLPLACMA